MKRISKFVLYSDYVGISITINSISIRRFDTQRYNLEGYEITGFRLLDEIFFVIARESVINKDFVCRYVGAF